MPGKCKTVVLYDFPQRGTMETPLIVGIFHSPKVFYVQRNAPLFGMYFFCNGNHRITDSFGGIR